MKESKQKSSRSSLLNLEDTTPVLFLSWNNLNKLRKAENDTRIWVSGQNISKTIKAKIFNSRMLGYYKRVLFTLVDQLFMMSNNFVDEDQYYIILEA